MTVYMTKVWGFDEPCGPLQFGTAGARETARSTLRPGDRVILVGTLSDPTAPENQGRVLGMMEPTPERVASLDFELPTGARDFDAEGNYKWPYGLHNRRAWIFEEPRPLLTDISSRHFYMDSAQGIVPLTEDEAARALAHPHRDITLLMPRRALARIEGEEVARRRGAPPPTTHRTGIMHLRRAPAQTYAMAVEGASAVAFKIGWAFEAKMRERHFNLAAVPTLGGVRYRIKLTEWWDTAKDAYAMEQSLLRTFDAARHSSNREILTGVSYDVLESAWIGYISSRRGRP